MVSHTRRAHPEERHGLRLVGHTDLGGHGDGMHINLKDGYAYFGHMGNTGTSIVDVRDPSAPTVVNRIPAPPNTHAHKVQIVGDVLRVQRERLPERQGGDHSRPWSAGIEVFDVSDPVNPVSLSTWETAGRGVHRMTYWTEPYAYLAAGHSDFDTEVLTILDLSDPSRPEVVSHWSLPGMARDEQSRWAPDRVAKLHHGTPRGDRLYCGWWDLGLVILDIADHAAPKLVSHLDFGAEQSKHTHSAVPLPGRDLLVVTDETNVEDCLDGVQHTRLVDISDELNPRVVSMLPIPQGDYCARGGRFGPHNVHEHRPGTMQDGDLVYLTYFSGGLRIYDVRDERNPTEIAWFVPPAPPGQSSIQFNDLIVGDDGLIYVSDRYHGGLYIFERE